MTIHSCFFPDVECVLVPIRLIATNRIARCQFFLGPPSVVSTSHSPKVKVPLSPSRFPDPDGLRNLVETSQGVWDMLQLYSPLASLAFDVFPSRDLSRGGPGVGGGIESLIFHDMAVCRLQAK